jgi:DNA-binding XRE family transcriptional regulator
MARGRARAGTNLDDYIKERKARDPAFAEGYDEGLHAMKMGIALKMARKEAKMTQGDVAAVMGTTKSVISRLERQATDMKVTTLLNYLRAVGKEMQIA